MSVLKSPLCRLLLFLGSLVLLSLPVHAQLHSLNYDFGWGDSGGEVAQNKTYEIKWSGEGISYMDIYLSQQTSRNDTINPDRFFDTLLAGHVTKSPYKWKVTQAVGSIWTLTFVPNGMKSNMPFLTGVQVVAKTSAATKTIPASFGIALSVLSVAALGQYLSL